MRPNVVSGLVRHGRASAIVRAVAAPSVAPFRAFVPRSDFLAQGPVPAPFPRRASASLLTAARLRGVRSLRTSKRMHGPARDGRRRANATVLRPEFLPNSRGIFLMNINRYSRIAYARFLVRPWVRCGGGAQGEAEPRGNTARARGWPPACGCIADAAELRDDTPRGAHSDLRGRQGAARRPSGRFRERRLDRRRRFGKQQRRRNSSDERAMALTTFGRTRAGKPA